MNTTTPRPQKKITDEIEDIVAHVKRGRGLGNRAARRFVGRRITPVTLAVWRAAGQFPVGFRAGSKGGNK